MMSVCESDYCRDIEILIDEYDRGNDNGDHVDG